MGHHKECCEAVLALLSEYLDLELLPVDCGEVESPLAHCPECVEFLASLRATIALCRDYSPGAMPGPLTDRARRELEEAWRNMLTARQHLTAK